MTQDELAKVKEALLNASYAFPKESAWKQTNDEALKIVTQEQLKLAAALRRSKQGT